MCVCVGGGGVRGGGRGAFALPLGMDEVKEMDQVLHEN